MDRPLVQQVPRRRRAELAEALQRVLGVLPESGQPDDRALRRDLRRFAEELRGLGDAPA